MQCLPENSRGSPEEEVDESDDDGAEYVNCLNEGSGLTLLAPCSIQFKCQMFPFPWPAVPANVGWPLFGSTPCECTYWIIEDWTGSCLTCTHQWPFACPLLFAQSVACAQKHVKKKRGRGAESLTLPGL